MLQLLGTFRGTTENLDKLKWRLDRKGKFSVKSVYYNMDHISNQNVSWPWKLIWKVIVPPKVSCFAQLVVRKACLTKDKLQRRGLPICSRRLLCGQEVESNEHLFVHCKTTINLFHMFFSVLRIK